MRFIGGAIHIPFKGTLNKCSANLVMMQKQISNLVYHQLTQLFKELSASFMTSSTLLISRSHQKYHLMLHFHIRLYYKKGFFTSGTSVIF